MSLSGSAVLINSMNIGGQDFNRWYDKRHLEERVATSGFLEARRYVVEDATQKYLGHYNIETIQVLDSPAYRERLANQTYWSLKNIAPFQNTSRACARLVISRGMGRGAALGFLRLRPVDNVATSSADSHTRIDAALDLDGVIPVQMLASDPDLSKSFTDYPDAAASAKGWYILIDAIGQKTMEPAKYVLDLAAIERDLKRFSTGRYRLLRDLPRPDFVI